MKLCQIYNGASLYRESIYKLLDKEFDTDWVFGSNMGDIKFMETNKLKGKVSFGKNFNLFGGSIIWQTNVINQLFKDYTHYIILGEERRLSTWIFLLFSLCFPKKKVFFWSHGQYGKESLMKRLTQIIFYRLVNGTFLYSNYAKNVMIDNGFNPNNLFVIHNSLSYNQQLSLRKSGLSSYVYRDYFFNDNPVLIFIGRLTKVKKLDQLIDAASILKDKGEEYNIVFIGDGSEKEFLLTKVGEQKLENQVWFYGACYDEKINAELIYNADLCVAPGNIGLTAMHTMVFGTPVITHNDFKWQMPEFEAIQKGVTGEFFERDNTQSLSDSISQWFFTNHNRREQVRQACYKEIDLQWNPYFQIEVFKTVIK